MPLPSRPTLMVLSLMSASVFSGRIRPHDDVNFLVVERHDQSQRPDRRARIGVARVGHVDERLVHVGLHERELHAGLETHALHVFSRAFRRHHFEVDADRLGHPFRQVVADLDIGAALRPGDDLVVGRFRAGQRTYDQYHQPQPAREKSLQHGHSTYRSG
ncbi:hypothetical protein QF002_009138 [Paraburkholderia youngii]